MLLKIIQGYYWSIFLFIILDYGFGINIRITGFIDHPLLKFLYYIFCIVCLILIYKLPGKAAKIGLVESSTNIIILIFGTYLPIYTSFDLIEAGKVDGIGITTERVINMIFAGTINALAYYYNRKLISSQSSQQRSQSL